MRMPAGTVVVIGITRHPPRGGWAKEGDSVVRIGLRVTDEEVDYVISWCWFLTEEEISHGPTRTHTDKSSQPRMNAD
jgi:hypothetical protein